ncbi:MAG: iron chelate uptake ABC transporter family permease subunit, partial [Sutterellaceae bacterium]|nr:iron chelate uptake ABC transporter family permease subunit [Sutterellaceae bacterium]
MSEATRYRTFILAGLALTLAAAFLALASGRYGLSFFDILATLSGTADNVSKTAEAVLFNVRIPRVVLALAAGAGLAAAGAAFQAIFSNPLATPDTLGVASGAAFGAVLGILLGLDAVFVQLTSFTLGLIAVGLV